MTKEYGFEAGKTHWEWDTEKPDVNKGIDDMLLGKMKENIQIYVRMVSFMAPFLHNVNGGVMMANKTKYEYDKEVYRGK